LDELLGRLGARDVRHKVFLHQPISVHENAKRGFSNEVAFKTHLSEIENKASREELSTFPLLQSRSFGCCGREVNKKSPKKAKKKL